MSILLKKCRLIPELSGGVYYPLSDIIIDQGKIQKILPHGESNEEHEIIDCDGKTILPGLFDLHVHLHTGDLLGNYNYQNDFKLMIEACFSAKSYLEIGITTIRDMGSANRVANAVRDVIKKELFIGPRIISSGKIIYPTNKSNGADHSLIGRTVTGHQEMMKAVREELGEGSDIVKIYASGSALSPTGVPTQPILVPEEVRAAVLVAKMQDKYVAAHCHSADAINMCLDEGVYTIEHATFVDDIAIEKLKKETSYLVPTLSPMSSNGVSFEDPIQRKQFLDKMKQLAKASADRIKKAYEAEIKLGFGTDISVKSLSEKIGIEFKMRKELCGMTNIDLLLQATKYSAKIAGLDGITGEVKVGLAADLILVSGCPVENIDVMYEKPEKVFMNGIQVK